MMVVFLMAVMVMVDYGVGDGSLLVFLFLTDGTPKFNPSTNRKWKERSKLNSNKFQQYHTTPTSYHPI